MVNPTKNKFSPLAYPTRASFLASLLVPFLLILACNPEKKSTDGDAAPQATGEAESAAASLPEKKEAPAIAPGSPYPQGPRFIIVPGKGFGPIRFGATVETVERHMGAPCELKTETSCLYVRQAAEFTFKDGVVAKMKAHMRDRIAQGPSGKKQAYGSFNGAMAPKIMLGLHRHIVLEEYGEPERKEPVKDPPELGLVDRHIYDGLVLEYDKIENGNIVLAGIEVTPSETAPVAGPKNAASVKKAAAEGKKAATKKEAPAPLKARSPEAAKP